MTNAEHTIDKYCESIERDLLKQKEKIAVLEAENKRLRSGLEVFRDNVLYQRGLLAENGMTSEQVNDVLNMFDEAIC